VSPRPLWTVELTQSDVEQFPCLASQIVSLGVQLPHAELSLNVDTGATSIVVTEGDVRWAEPVVDELRDKASTLISHQERAEESVSAGTAEDFDFQDYCETHDYR
jgi:NAD-dependent oxidoreductase involved in siderophore biosynthesis